MLRHRHDVAEHRRRGRRSPGAATVEHDLTGRLGLDEDCVESTAYAGERMSPRHHRRVNAHDDALLVVAELGHGEELDDEAHLLGGDDVLGRDTGDALAVDVIEMHTGVEREPGEDRGLRRRVVALDIGRGVGLGVPEGLRLGEDIGVVGAVLVHLGQDEVGGAVDDAEHAAHLVAGEALAQRAKEWHRPRDRGLEVEVDAVGLGGRVELGAVLREQRLVGGHDRGTRCHGCEDERAGRLDAAHHLDHDVRAASDQTVEIVGDQRVVDAFALLGGIADTHTDKSNRGACSGSEVVGGLAKQARDLAAHGAAAEQGDGELTWGGHAGPSDRGSRGQACHPGEAL